MRVPDCWQDRARRPFLLATGTLAMNLFLALAHGALGLWTRSAWYLALAAYYAILGVMRWGVLRMSRRDNIRFLRRFCGGMLIALSLVLAQLAVIDLFFERGTAHHRIVMISLATCTCVKVTLAVVNVMRARHAPVLRTLRNIACADAAASVVSMQRSMIVTFGGMEATALLNALSGGAACLFVLGMGARMLLDGRREKMAKSKLVQANRRIMKAVVNGYRTIEQSVGGGYSRIETWFIDRYLTREGESVEDARERLKKQP